MQSRSELATRRRQAPAKPATKVLSVDFSTYRKARSGWARAMARPHQRLAQVQEPGGAAVQREAEEEIGRNEILFGTFGAEEGLDAYAQH